MKKRSGLSLNAVFKGFQVLAPHPWVVNKLIALQLAKWFFPLGSVRSAAGRAGKIHQLSIRITDLCNLRCHTCGQWGDSGFMHGSDIRMLKQNEISSKRYIELFKDLVANGHKPNVYLWGGEPTMYKDMEKVIHGATSLKLPTSISTNGQTLASYADFYVGEPLFLLQVSIDGHDRSTHNAARPAAGKGDSFGDIEQGLEAVKAAKGKRGSSMPLVASLTVISRQNVQHLTDIYHRFKDHVDIFVFYLAWWIDEQSARLHEQDFHSRFGFRPQLHRGWQGSWQPDDYSYLAEQLDALQKLGTGRGPAVTIIPNLNSTGDLESYYTDHRQTFGYNQCISVYQVVELDSNGNMSPCRDYHDYVVGNVKEQSITELWNCEQYLRFRKSIREDGLMPVCTRCCGLMGY